MPARSLPPVLTLLAALALAAPAAASSNHCSLPRVDGFTWSSLHESGIGCDAARTLGVRYLRHGRLEGWSCSHRIHGRFVQFTCYHASNHHQTLAGGWAVH